MHLRYFRLTALLLLVFILLPPQSARAADPDPEIGEPAAAQAEEGRPRTPLTSSKWSSWLTSAG
jgi:hypothetical protein